MNFEEVVEVEGEEGVTLRVGLCGLEAETDISLLFVHGMGSSGATWHNQMTHLSHYFQVICPDLRGHGVYC